jgi:hypothetical protein
MHGFARFRPFDRLRAGPATGSRHAGGRRADPDVPESAIGVAARARRMCGNVQGCAGVFSRNATAQKEPISRTSKNPRDCAALRAGAHGAVRPEESPGSRHAQERTDVANAPDCPGMPHFFADAQNEPIFLRRAKLRDCASHAQACGATRGPQECQQMCRNVPECAIAPNVQNEPISPPVARSLLRPLGLRPWGTCGSARRRVPACAGRAWPRYAGRGEEGATAPRSRSSPVGG